MVMLCALTGACSIGGGVAVLVPAGPVAAAANEPLLIEHGYDIDTAGGFGRHLARMDSLPFDGYSIQPALNPCSPNPVDPAVAQADMAEMPKPVHATHNFLLCRLLADANPDGSSPFDVNNDATWATIASNLTIYAQAARATGMFDGIMFDTEYYGKGPNPWDYDTIPIPWTYEPGRSRPWTLPSAAKDVAQRRGKQTMDAIRSAWPDVVAFHLRGGELSDPNTFKPGNMAGYDVAWANELAGPFFVGAVESAMGTAASVVDGGESYHQRTLSDFVDSYTWLETRFAESGGLIVPSGPVSGAAYNATVSVASQVFDKDITQPDRPTFSSNQMQVLLSYSRQATDKYRWLFSEAFDWRGSGWPSTPVPQEYVDAVRGAVSPSAVERSATGTLVARTPARLIDSRPTGQTVDGSGARAGRLAPGQVFEVPIAGRAGVPADAKAAALVFTVTGPTSAGFLTAWPCGAPRPVTSIANFPANRDVAAAMVLGLGTLGKVCVTSSVSAYLLVDVDGHAPSAASYVGLTPARLVDTRSPHATIDGQQSGSGLVAGGSSLRVQVLGRGGVPADASMAYLTVTLVGQRLSSFATVYRCGQPVPNVSTVNVLAGRDAANSTIVRLWPEGVCVYVSTGVHVIVDVTGYENPASVFRADVNSRAWDTRDHGAMLNGANLRIPIAVGPSSPGSVATATLNATVANATGAGFVTVYPSRTDGSCPAPPDASSLNFVAGETVANMAFSRLTADASGKSYVCAFSSVATNFIIDVIGYST